MKRGYADTPEGQIHYTEDGSGEPLLLLGQTGSSRSLLKLLPLLSRKYRVFAIDNLGEGNSDPLPPGAEISDMARSYVHFMDALGFDRAHVFGAYTGNKIGTELGAGWPSRVDGLILSGQTHSMQTDQKDLLAVMGARNRPMLQRFEHSPDGAHLVKEWATQFNYISTIWWGTDVAALDQLTPEVLQHRKERVLDALQLRSVTEKYRAIFAFDLGSRMRDIKVKTLVIEIRVPAEAHLAPQGPKILELIPNSRLVTVEHKGAGRAIEAKAGELAENIQSFLEEIRSVRIPA